MIHNKSTTRSVPTSHRRRRHGLESLRWASLASALVGVCGCSAGAEDATEPDLGILEQDVVGGSQEAGYPSAGYLTRGAVGGAPTNRLCTAVQVGPNMVLTGGHCFVNWNASPPVFITANNSWGFGRGEVANGEIYTASRVTIHPQYNPNAAVRYNNDLALVHFDQAISGGTWSEVVDGALGTNCGAANASENHTYVGYGRDTAGGSGVPGNINGDRKSATQCTTSVDAITLDVSGVDGGLCWGDSGGPLFETGEARVSGVLSDFDTTFNCQIGNAMIFTRLSAFRDFICDNTVYVGNGELCGRSLAAELSVL